MEDILEKINSNFGAALLALLIVTLILHIFLVYPRNLTKKQWKKTDYIWLALTSIGLFGSTRNVEKMINEAEIPSLNYQITFQYEQMQNFIDNGESSWLCGEMTRTEYSPDNFDALVEEYRKGCEWEKIVIKSINSAKSNNFQVIDTTKFPTLITDAEPLKDYLRTSLDIIGAYNQLVKERNIKENSLFRSSVDFMLQYFSPLLLILGIALRITKVSGEIRHEKN